MNINIMEQLRATTATSLIVINVYKCSIMKHNKQKTNKFNYRKCLQFQVFFWCQWSSIINIIVSVQIGDVYSPYHYFGGTEVGPPQLLLTNSYVNFKLKSKASPQSSTSHTNYIYNSKLSFTYLYIIIVNILCFGTIPLWCAVLKMVYTKIINN